MKVVQNLLHKRIVQNVEEAVKIGVHIAIVVDLEHVLQNMVLDLLWEFHLAHG